MWREWGSEWGGAVVDWGVDEDEAGLSSSRKILVDGEGCDRGVSSTSK